LICTVSDRQIPLEVYGKLPAEDITGIVSAAKREMRREIFPNLSWQSLKEAPKAIRACFGIKLITVHADGPAGALVYLFRETNGFPASRPDRLWNGIHVIPVGAIWTASIISMEKRSNGWFVIDSASL
jgi:hypothetical protein